MSYQGVWNKEFGEIVSSGVTKSLPQAFVSDDTTNIYKVAYAIDVAMDKLANIQLHRDKGRTIETPYSDNAIGSWLDELGRYWGIERLSDEPTDSFINRLTYHWGQFEGGGSSGSLKQTIWYFIGPEAFSGTLETSNEIIISDPTQSGSQIYYWNDVVDSRWGSGATVYSYWRSGEDNLYGFNIDIYIQDNEYDTVPRRNHFDYWASTDEDYADQAERNRVLLKRIIDEVKPLGKTYNLAIHGTAPP